MSRKKSITYDTIQMNICTCGKDIVKEWATDFLVDTPWFHNGIQVEGNTFTSMGKFVWANLGGHLVLLCLECTDKLFKGNAACKELNCSRVSSATYEI